MKAPALLAAVALLVAPATATTATKPPAKAKAAATGGRVVTPPRSGGVGAPKLTVGPRPLARSVKGVTIPAGAAIQPYLDRYPEGTTFLLSPGVYREQFRLAPRARQRLIGRPGAILSGARLVSAWQQDGDRWTADGAFLQGGHGPNGECLKEAPLCSRPEMLFVDDRLVPRVADRSSVAPGTWALDPATWRIVLGSDPRSRTVEVAREGVAVVADVGRPHDSVELRNLVVEKYATPAQECALQLADTGGGFQNVNDPSNGRGGWTVAAVELRWNHACGVFAGAGTKVLDSWVHDNGQVGVKGTGRGVVVRGNEISGNNWAGFEVLWEAGGLKLWNAAATRVEGNWVHGNRGNGLWADYALEDVQYIGNSITENTHAGIVHEMTVGGKVLRNYLRGNDAADRGDVGYMKGAVMVFASPDVEVAGNVLERNVGGVIALAQERGCIAPMVEQGTGQCPAGAVPGTLRNLWVHDNEIVQDEGFSGVEALASANYPPYAEQPASWARTLFTASNIRFDRNRYSGKGFRSSLGPKGQYDDESLRFVWGLPHGYSADPANVYSWTERRFLGFDDWRRLTGQDRNSRLS